MKINYIGMVLLSILLLSSYMKSGPTSDLQAASIIFDFESGVDISSWKILNDDVMGGVSKASFEVSNDGNGLFQGEVFTANNGGFASVRHRPAAIDLTKKTTISIRLKGDGKEYQFRVKKNIDNYASYVTTFKTSGSWETIDIDLSDLYPSFRGRKLKQANYDMSSLAELCFLIANKKNERFKLLIDCVSIR